MTAELQRLSRLLVEARDERDDALLRLSKVTELKNVGKRVSAWRLAQFGPQTATRHALQLCEEAGEVARAVGKAEEGVRPETRGDLASELADVVLCACGLARTAGIDLDAAVAARLERLERLDFRKNPEAGQGEGT